MYNVFSAADIMLPAFINESDRAKKWAVIACDQFTSEPEYWEMVYSIVKEAHSTVHMILPEAFLAKQSSELLGKISDHMSEYSQSILDVFTDSLVLVRRTLSNGKIRSGIVGKVDLELYDYSVSSTSPIRATEGTVLERIPPRVAVRREATLELPHVMLLIDDKSNSVIEPLLNNLDSLQRVYDFNLMLDGGHIEGYLLNNHEKDHILDRLNRLFENSDNSISLAVGDGNHSLATAKARYEELKKQIGEEKARNHPLRYALCEVVNLHDDSLEFEPIYRLVKTNDVDKLINALKEYGANCSAGNQSVKCIFGNHECNVLLGAGTHTLTVGTLQKFLDEYIAKYPESEIDYIHGIDSIKKLSMADDCVGFIFEGMRKEELFNAVEQDGALPRKTFSMGEATDKRYYIECRRITE